MTARRARTAWNGTLENGSGQVELSSSGLGTYDVSFPSRAADAADGRTSPEELIAAAHSSCFAMQLSGVLGAEGFTADALHITAEVELGPDPAGGFRIPGIRLVVTGEVAGIDEARFVELAEVAKSTCPVSKALAGTTITLEASLS